MFESCRRRAFCITQLTTTLAFALDPPTVANQQCNELYTPVVELYDVYMLLKAIRT